MDHEKMTKLEIGAGIFDVTFKVVVFFMALNFCLDIENISASLHQIASSMTLKR